MALQLRGRVRRRCDFLEACRARGSCKRLIDATPPSTVPVPDWHKAELERRLANPAPGPGLTWEEVQAKLRDLKRT